MNPAESPKAFKPISKAFAADLLGVSTKTIDNYIRDALLPLPRPFGGREPWHPGDFYRHLDARLEATTETAYSDSASTMPAKPESADTNHASQTTTHPPDGQGPICGGSSTTAPGPAVEPAQRHRCEVMPSDSWPPALIQRSLGNLATSNCCGNPCPMPIH